MEIEVILPDAALGEGSANNHCVNVVSFRFLSFQLLCCFVNFMRRNTTGCLLVFGYLIFSVYQKENLQA
jgi:hypothetical protein